MKFPTRVNGIPCICHVTYYFPPVPATWDDPEDTGDFEFEILDTRGREAKWLWPYITDEVRGRMGEEHHILLQAEELEMADYG